MELRWVTCLLTRDLQKMSEKKYSKCLCVSERKREMAIFHMFADLCDMI